MFLLEVSDQSPWTRNKNPELAMVAMVGESIAAMVAMMENLYYPTERGATRQLKVRDFLKKICIGSLVKFMDNILQT